MKREEEGIKNEEEGDHFCDQFLSLHRWLPSSPVGDDDDDDDDDDNDDDGGHHCVHFTNGETRTYRCLPSPPRADLETSFNKEQHPYCTDLV